MKKIRLSQCMIVKNEEKNIRRALSWAKGIAFEQIVVDTGSTDRTVEIAQEMGAKVYHFQWINDFAAAKNYAIDQASGDWIAFLDADEYFQKEDAEKLLQLLERLSSIRPESKIPLFVRCAWIQLDEQGKPFSIDTKDQDRIFRNLPCIRYHGRIHEQIQLPNDRKWFFFRAEDILSIFHTGYTQTAYEETGKLQRNIELLKRELEEHPDDYNAWSYLGDSQKIAGNFEDAQRSYQEALKGEGTARLRPERLLRAQKGLLRLLSETALQPETKEEIYSLARKMGYPETQNPDVYFYLAIWNYNRNEMKQARKEFLRTLEILEGYKGTEKSDAAGNLERLYAWLAQACLILKRLQEAVQYGVLTLRMNRYQDNVLAAILKLLSQEPGEADQAKGTWGFLRGLYDFQSQKDLLFLYKCGKIAGVYALTDRLLEAMPSELKEEILKVMDREEESEDSLGIEVRNRTDQWFLSWTQKIYRSTEEELVGEMKDFLSKWKKRAPSNYDSYVAYYGKCPLWGSLDPKKNDYDTFVRRAHTLKTNLDDLIWLYNKLEDYRSKMSLLAVLLNWTDFNTRLLDDIRERSPQYFDLDLIPSAENEVFVDVGAYVGDSILKFIGMYGKNYRKIYAYEPDRENVDKMKRNTAEYQDVEIRRKGAGKEQGELCVLQGFDPSANQVVETGERESSQETDLVEIVSLDEDIQEPVTWIKMDVEGAEYDALLGCRRHIQEEAPKLSISVYHGYDDLWRLPKLIHGLNPSYRFYLRYYGGNLIPTEIVLTALPGEETES